MFERIVMKRIFCPKCGTKLNQPKWYGFIMFSIFGIILLHTLPLGLGWLACYECYHSGIPLAVAIHTSLCILGIFSGIAVYMDFNGDCCRPFGELDCSDD